MSVASDRIAAAALPARLQGLVREFWRYGLASAVALGVDFAILLLLTEVFHVHYLISAATSFSVGAVVAYVLSVTFVFHKRRVKDRRFEFLCFLAIGILGLAVNQLVLAGAVEILGFSYPIGKAAAAVLSFVINFAARRALLFVDKTR